MAHSIARGIVAATLTFAAAAPAFAQDTSVYLMTRNKLGLITWCASEGLMDQAEAEETRATYENMLANFPLEKDEARGDEMEAAGEQGLWGTMKLPVDDQRALFDMTREEFCADQGLAPGL